jgi:hypothetical protein
MDYWWNDADIGKQVLGENPCPVLHCPRQISRGHYWHRTRTSVARGRRLTAWAMAGRQQFDARVAFLHLPFITVVHLKCMLCKNINISFSCDVKQTIPAQWTVTSACTILKKAQLISKTGREVLMFQYFVTISGGTASSQLVSYVLRYTLPWVLNHTKGHRNLSMWPTFYVRVCALHKYIRQSRYVPPIRPWDAV